MAFAVITVASELSADDGSAAREAGPTFVSAPGTYEELLVAAGWDLVERIDVTAGFIATTAAIVRETEARSDALEALLGRPEAREIVASRRATAGATHQGLLERYVFVSSAI